MTKTITICDCCGQEAPVVQCVRELRTHKGEKRITRTWELCLACCNHLEDVIESEALRMKGKDGK